MLLFEPNRVVAMPQPFTPASQRSSTFDHGVRFCTLLLLGITITSCASAPTQEIPLPPAVVISATITPTPGPWLDSQQAFDKVVFYITETYPQRADLSKLTWTQLETESQDSPGRGTMRFTSDEWLVRAFDGDLEQQGNLIEMNVKNEISGFIWEGYVHSGELKGWLASGGWVPKPTEGEDGDRWLAYANERYGYRFEYPPEALVREEGVAWFEVDEKPEGLSAREFYYELYERLGPNLCVKVELGEGYILFDPPENHTRYTYCRRFGQQTGEYVDRTLEVQIGGETFTAEGKEFLQTGVTDPEQDEWYAVNLDSGMRIEFGANAYKGDSFENYRTTILPLLIQILGSYQALPRNIE